MSEKNFIERLLSNDTEAYEALVERFRDKVIRTANGFLHNINDAEDIAQEVFIEVFRSLKRFRKESELSTWIYRITVNKSLNQYRKQSRRSFAERTQFLTGEKENFNNIVSNERSDKDVLNKERRTILFNAIDNLPKNQKIAFVLSKYDDLPHKEISQIMNISLSAVESLVFRAKKNLQNMLVKYYDSLL